MSNDFNFQNDTEDNEINFREILEKYLANWKWFLLSVVLCTILAFLYLNFKRPVFRASTTIKIKNENESDKTALSAFKDLGILSTSKENIEDEIEILKSKSLLSEVVRSLNLNVIYLTDKNYISDFLDENLGLSTNFFTKENYEKPPIKINFLSKDKVSLDTISGKYMVKINSADKFTIENLETGYNKQFSFGDKFKSDFGEVIITPVEDLAKDNLVGEDIFLSLHSTKGLVDYYSTILEIESKSDFSNIVTLTITGGVKQKAEDFLNELVEKYNERAIFLKEELSKSTTDFVNTRLTVISEELANIDLTAESIKTKYKLSDAATETGVNIQAGKEIEGQIVQASTQLQSIDYLKDKITNKKGNDLLPTNVGVVDPSVSGSINQYNQIMAEKKRLLANSTEKNPTIVRLNEQLNSLRTSIDQGLSSLKSTQEITLNNLNKQGSLINSRLYGAPKKERQYREVQRKQSIKEQLYLYLLQKREETALMLGVADPNAKVIDTATSEYNSISPKKTLTYLAAGFLGLFIPVGVMIILGMLDTKIHTREDVEKVLNIPIIGDIPKIQGNTSKQRYLIKNQDFSSIAEAFRILRTNLDFIIPNNESNNNKGKVIFVTSTIAHEGKSLISSNLATALAHANKKTLIIGMDVRAPGLKPYIGVRGKFGVTNFIVNNDLNPRDLIVRNENISNLDIISSGDIAPNPSELLMNKRVSELVDFAKENYEYIIVDTAAFSKVTDTLIISNLADAFIYVIRANYLDKRLLKYIKAIHKDNRIPNISLLVNGISFKKSYGYGYGYGNEFDKKKQI